MSDMANGKKRSVRELNDYQEKPLKLVKREYDQDSDHSLYDQHIQV